jgi:hypothetical protein
MKRFAGLASPLILLSVAACGAARPGGGAGRAGGPQPPAGIEPPPIYALLGQRERLELTSEQIAALDSIGIWIDTANSAARATLGPALLDGGDPANGGPGRVIPRDSASLAARSVVVANNAAALNGVVAVLKEAQRARVCELFDPERVAVRAPERRRRSVAPASGNRWPWCAPAGEATAQSAEVHGANR